MRTALIALTTVALATVAQAAVLPAATAAPAKPSGRPERVIVILGQHQNVPATTRDLGKRRAAVKADQSPVRAQISKLGGRTTKAYRAVNAVAATVPAGGLAALRSNPAVTAVVPDLPIALPSRAATGAPVKSKAATPQGRYCPSGSTPQLEPEALELTHTDSDQGTAPTARSLGYTGSGVKVGFIADGTDINQPDLIRADGSHVVTDYRDFSGDGTTSPTSGAEAMGDVSSIAAQGRTSYDISSFVTPAHPLPAGCDIRIEGMAPGASVVALKVFANNLLTAPTSTIVQAIDYAVNVDHVNVLNESFGSNPYPDNATDPISIANQDAIDAGVAVTASTGDSGTGNTLGTASTDPNVIAAGASTSERVYAQTDNYAFPLSNGKYTSNQVSGLSSGGISQTNRVQDLLAPGDLGWSLCSNATLPSGDPQYVDCTDYNGNPSNIQVFGGTSQSAPLTAGAAALVIQAYRAGHDGATPTPAVVRTVLTSSADDLGLPADEQGAGLLNTYRAVQLAHDYRTAQPAGQELSASTPQVKNVTAPGKHVTDTVTLTNQGTGPQRVTAAVRQVSHVSSRQVQSVAFDPKTAPTFQDALGRPRPYVLKTFTVPVGTDRLDAAVSIAGDGTKYVRASLLDPQKTFTAYTLPQGTGNYGHVDVHQPAPGTWTAIVWSAGPPDASTVSGPISLRTTYFTATSAGSVSPASATIPQGGSQKFRVTTTVPANEAAASSLVFTHRFGLTTTVPIVDRAVQSVTTRRPATFSGTFDQANGRDFSPAQSFTYLVDVPSGARDLDVNVAVSGVPSNQIIAHLSDPSGEPVSTGRNDLPPTGTATTGRSYGGLQLVHANPRPGRYQLTLELQNQSSGAALPLTFRGSFVLNGAAVSGSVPHNVRVSKRHAATATIRITNTSPTPQTYFVDGRTNSLVTYPLVASDVAGEAPDKTNPYSRTVPFPLASDDVVPAWLVPTQVRSLTVGSSSTDPITFDLMPLDSPTTLNAPNNPDTESTVSGRSATATHSAPEVGSTQWAAFPSPLGPVPADGQPSGSVTMSAAVRARAFDGDVTSSTGDPLLATVRAAAPATHAITIAPGRHATITVHFTPHGAVGSRHTGTLYVDIAQPFGPAGYSTLTEEVRALTYSYTVTR
ncbi:S8 family serine peptidase [uncultured Jatrophihabitans sp.]|uniref:S8 family serine peptidase n=1 Tax=uncultured Jatrophihabitans sp. TaxID=1610747 RepID=UPI0035C97C32